MWRRPDRLAERPGVEFRVDRRARRISLSICPARRRLILVAPSERTRRAAYEFLDSRMAWAQQELARLPAPMPLQPDVHIPLRGAMVRLVPVSGRGSPRLGDDDGALLVPGRPEALPGRVRRFLKAEAERDLSAALARHCATLNLPPPPVRLRDTRSRWGSCTSDGAISFSWRLICAPEFVLDHVAAHEAAHLVHLNHGPRFRTLEKQLSPRLGEAADWLAANGPLLHAVGADC
jgi:predicted metal-dependent hydrolase